MPEEMQDKQIKTPKPAVKPVKVMYQPDDSDQEEVSVSFDGASLLFKRGVARDCGPELAAALLKQPEKFKLSQEG